MNLGTERQRHFLLGLLTAIAYVASAKLGLTLAFVAEQVTVVWPATGIALAAVLLLGYRIWPFIAMGAFIANVTTNTPALTSIGIAAGNTLEALTGAFLLQRFVGIERSLHRFRDLFGLIFYGSILSTIVSATIGTVSLCLSGVQPWESFNALWGVWFLGDALGEVVFAPLVLTLFSPPARRPIRARALEFAALLLVLVAIGLVAFGGTRIFVSSYPAPDYAVLPVLIWAALRFGILGTSISIVVSSTIAVLGTVKGYGPFTSGSTHENLIALQLYMFVAAITGLALAVTKAGRDRAEDSLHRSEQRYRSLVMTSSQVVWTTNATGDVVEPLPSWTAFTGQSPADTVGRGWASRLHPDDVEQATRIWEHSLATGAPHENEFRVLAADGVYRYVHAHAVPILEPDGKVREWVGTLTDITPRKQADMQMEEENRRKDEFLAMLAHELRNPLAAIAGALQVLRLTRGDETHFDQMAEITSRQTQHMSRILDDLLDVSRITRGVVELDRQAADLTVLAQKCLQHARMTAEKKSVVVTTSLSQMPLPVFVDVTRIEQVIINLINNAVKFTRAGGQIHISTGHENDFATLTVRDTGVGIEKTFLPQIFDLFTQADRSFARSEGGLGIGLTLVRTLVLMHGGQVQAHSEGVGHGSMFVVRLPLSLQPAAESSPQLMPVPAGRHKILIIEDNVDSAESLSIIVNLMGHETFVAHDGIQGIEIFNAVKPNVVLLDIGLPKLNGYEVAERLRAENPKLKLIALTGYGARADRERTLQVGFDLHLVKPVDVAVLRKLLT